MVDADSASATGQLGRNPRQKETRELPPGGVDHRRSASGACDGCRTRKSKCDLNRPTCRPCRNRGVKCNYTLRRKPGPRRGTTKRRADQDRVQLNCSQDFARQISLPSSLTPSGNGSELQTFWPDLGSIEITSTLNNCTPEAISLEPVDPNIIYLAANFAPQTAPDLYPAQLPQELQEHLISLYFTHIQPVHQLFRRTYFSQRFELGLVSVNLLNAMFALSARFSTREEILNPVNGEAWRAGDAFARRADECQHIFSAASLRKSSLDDLQAVVLLTVFETTRFPDRKAWLNMSNAIHFAYELGLDKIDAHQIRSTSCDVSHLDGMHEEARYLWWCIWKLDTYFSIGMAIPFGIEDESNLTALLSTSVSDFTDNRVGCPKNVLLGEKSDLSLLLEKIAVDDQGMRENIFIIANSLLREASTIRRLTPRTHGSVPLRERRTILEKSLSIFQDGLPPDYQTVSRFSYETPVQHRQRLETSIQIHLTYIYLYMPVSKESDSNAAQIHKSHNWQKCVHHAELIIQTLRDWPLGYLQHTDCMMSFALWTVFLILFLQMKISSVDAEICRLSTSLDLLRLVLSNFSPYWGVTQILLCCFDNLKLSSKIYRDLSSIENTLIQYDGPLNQAPRHFTMPCGMESSAGFPSFLDLDVFWSGDMIDTSEGDYTGEQNRVAEMWLNASI